MASAARSPGTVITSPLRTALAVVMLLAVLAAGCGSSSTPAEDRAATAARPDDEAPPAETAGPEPAQSPAAAEDGGE